MDFVFAINKSPPRLPEKVWGDAACSHTWRIPRLPRVVVGPAGPAVGVVVARHAAGVGHLRERVGRERAVLFEAVADALEVHAREGEGPHAGQVDSLAVRVLDRAVRRVRTAVQVARPGVPDEEAQGGGLGLDAHVFHRDGDGRGDRLPAVGQRVDGEVRAGFGGQGLVPEGRGVGVRVDLFLHAGSDGVLGPEVRGAHLREDRSVRHGERHRRADEARRRGRPGVIRAAFAGLLVEVVAGLVAGFPASGLAGAAGGEGEGGGHEDRREDADEHEPPHWNGFTPNILKKMVFVNIL